MKIERACVEDAEEILALQKLAYVSEAEIYQDYNIPPMTQTLDQIVDDFGMQLFLKAIEAGKIVGSVRAYLKEQTCYVGRLVVHPDFRNRGIGTLLLKEIEVIFQDAYRFELFTGHLSAGNLRIYRRLGYEPFAEKPLSDNLTLVLLEKKKQFS